MKPINIHEPVWNGGNASNHYRKTYLSIKASKINKGVNFCETDYTNKHGDRTFPDIYYLPSSYCNTIYQERWGEAYHVFLKELETVRFYFTIAWDGEDEGEYSNNRRTYNYMVEGIKDYLNQWEKRGAYLDCCSMETSYKSHCVDLTDHVKKELYREAV